MIDVKKHKNISLYLLQLLPNLCYDIKSLLIILSLVIHIPINGNAQTLRTIEDLEQTTQKHLDEGVNMLGYTSSLYVQMDSLLNVVYSKLRKTLPDKEREKLKQEQLTWLKKRDAYFKKQYKDEEKESGVHKSEWGELEYMIVYDSQMQFVKQRVIVLINALNKK